MKSYNFIKRELCCIHFLDIFQGFRCNNFKTPSWKDLWWNLEQFWVVVLFLLNCDSTRDHFCKFFGILSPQKMFVMRFYSGRSIQYFWEKNFFIEVAHQVMVKSIKFETHSYALKTKLSFKSFGKYLKK